MYKTGRQSVDFLRTEPRRPEIFIRKLIKDKKGAAIGTLIAASSPLPPSPPWGLGTSLTKTFTGVSSAMNS